MRKREEGRAGVPGAVGMQEGAAEKVCHRAGKKE